jgi:ATPase subunit of ABC transporter with duplicated ATPase domains
VDAYDGGYAAYVLARAERARMAAATQARRRNLLRKELAWLRRGAPARTSKPKFRLDAASQLIENEPPPRDELALRQLATSRLGKDVLEFQDVGLAWPGSDRSPILDHTDLILGAGDRIGLIGVNGSGKTTVLRLLDGTLAPTSGRVRRGASVRLAHLSQHVDELDDDERVLESVQRLRRQTALATGQDVSTDTLLGDFGFAGDRLVTRIGELSGGERRRLQFLRLLLGQPNVLLLDEPTNDLDIDTLTVVEDYLDTWPGTLVVASHDRYFLERVTDVSYALMDGTLKLLPGGVDEYLAWADARAQAGGPVAESAPLGTPAHRSTPAQLRAARKQLSRVESQLDKARQELARTHAAMAGQAQDYAALMRLHDDEQAQSARIAALEDEWLALAEQVEQLAT